MTTTSPADVHTLVDLERYPLHDPTSPRYEAVLADARTQLAAIGAAELTGFVPAEGVERLVEDAIRLEPLAHRSGGTGTVYLGRPDDELPEDHPRRYVHPYAVGAVAYDQFPASSPLRRLYESEPLRAFIEAVLDRGPVYRYADPLGALNLAAMGPGDELQWHFDQTDFVVSLAVRSSTVGGDFEVAPRIRSTEDEHYDRVASVLAGDHSEVITLPMRPGTLLVFEGRHSLHRVSPVGGTTSRLVGLLGYDTRPDTTSSELLQRVRYGRCA